MQLLSPTRLSRAVIGLSILIIVGAGARAQTLGVPEGQALSLKLDAPANTVAVGDVEIADARIAFGDTVVLVGKEPGLTNLIVFDDAGDEMFSSVVTVSPALNRRPVTVLEGLRRRTLICGPTHCTEPREPDQVIQQETTVTGEGEAQSAITQEIYR